jgi:hypothetical protein
MDEAEKQRRWDALVDLAKKAMPACRICGERGKPLMMSLLDEGPFDNRYACEDCYRRLM